MKNSIKAKNIICIILISILFVLTTNVYASTDSFKTSLSVNNSTVKKGENITVTIALSEIAIESGEKGIGAYTAYLDFDSSVFEYVETNGTSNWETPLYQDAYIEGITEDGEVVKTPQDIGSITLKVKDDAKLGETTIKLTHFSGTNAEFDITAEDSSITITIVSKDAENQGESGNQGGDEGQGGNGSQSGDEGQGGSGSQGGNEGQGGSGSQSGDKGQSGSGNQSGNEGQNENASGNVNGNSANQNGGTNNNKEDIKQGTLPQTGNSNIAIFLTIGILVILAIICLIRIRLLKNKR